MIQKSLRYKDIVYDNYVISEDGIIFSKSMNREIKRTSGSGNRVYVYLKNEPHKKPLRVRVDELMLNTFYPELDIFNREDVKIIYKDGDFNNLNINNLELKDRPIYKSKMKRLKRIEETKRDMESSNEVWKGVITPDGIDVSKYYLVSSNGRIYSIKSGKIIKSIIKSKDLQYYKCLISIREINLHKQYLVGRIVASTFIGIPDSRKLVKYKNGNTLDNSVTNIYYA